MLVNHERQAELPYVLAQSHRLPIRPGDASAYGRLPGNHKATSPWSQEAISALAVLGTDPSLRPRDIASRLNDMFPPKPDAVVTPFSRNSVIGKAHRENIRILGATVTRTAEERERDSTRPRQMARTTSSGRRRPKAAMQAKKAAAGAYRAPPAPKTTDVQRLRIRAGAAGLEAIHQSLIDQHEADGHDLFSSPIVADVECPDARELWGNTTIYHPAMVPDKACRYPTALSTRRRTHLVCGSPTDGKAPYCEWHGRLCRSN